MEKTWPYLGMETKTSSNHPASLCGILTWGSRLSIGPCLAVVPSITDPSLFWLQSLLWSHLGSWNFLSRSFVPTLAVPSLHSLLLFLLWVSCRNFSFVVSIVSIVWETKGGHNCFFITPSSLSQPSKRHSNADNSVLGIWGWVPSQALLLAVVSACVYTWASLLIFSNVWNVKICQASTVFCCCCCFLTRSLHLVKLILLFACYTFA